MMTQFSLFCVLIMSFVINAADTSLVRGHVYLQTEDGFILITPEVAKERFNGLEWIEGTKGEDQFPPLIIKKINDRVGYGLFAGADIAKGKRVFYYAGKKTAHCVSSIYSLWSPHNSCLNAETQGNAGRFALHAPMNLNNYLFSKDVDVNSVTSANVTVDERQEHNGFPVYVALKKIKKGDLIAHDYSFNFCISLAIVYKQQIELFYKNGDIVPRDKRKPIIITILTHSPWSSKTPNLWQGTKEQMKKIMAPVSTVYFGTPPDMGISKATLLNVLSSDDEIFALEEEGCLYCMEVESSMVTCETCHKAMYCSKTCREHDRQFHSKLCGTNFSWWKK